jgi:hypothetical protein
VLEEVDQELTPFVEALATHLHLAPSHLLAVAVADQTAPQLEVG